MRRLRRLVIVLALLQSGLSSIMVSADEPELPRKAEAGGLQLAFILSFADDACGDPVHGAIFRRAILGKLAGCRMPQSKKDSIARDLAAYQTDAKTEIQHLFMHYGRPLAPHDLGMSCQAYFQAQQERLQQLDAYAAGKVKIDEMWNGACDPTEGGL